MIRALFDRRVPARRGSRALDFALDAWAEADPTYRPAQEARTLRERLGSP